MFVYNWGGEKFSIFFSREIFWRLVKRKTPTSLSKIYRADRHFMSNFVYGFNSLKCSVTPVFLSINLPRLLRVM